MGNVTPGALFRLPDGTTGMVTSDGGIGITYRMDRLDIGTIAPHIICEPGDGPIRGNDKALADAQARAARMEAERNSAIMQWNEARAELHDLRGELTRERDEARSQAAAIQQREAEYRAAVNALARERDEARKLLVAVSNGQADVIEERVAARRERDDAIVQRNDANAEVRRLTDLLDAVTHERDALRVEFQADHEALVAKIAAFEDACGLVDADGAPVEYDLSTLTFRRVGGDAVDHPSHYTATEFEPVVVIEALAPHYHVGAAIKYLARAPHKGRLAEDLKKARWYLLRAVACGVVGRKHPNGRRIAASWCAHYPEKLRESAEDAIDYMLHGDYDRSQLLVLACLDAIGGDACTG